MRELGECYNPGRYSGDRYVSFYDCHNLTSVKLPSTLKKIKQCAFARDLNLVNLILPEGLEIIEESAFSGCEKLKGLKMPAGVKSIGEYALNF